MTSEYIKFAESMARLGWEEVHHPDYRPNPHAERISKLFPQYFATYRKGTFASPMGLKILDHMKNNSDAHSAIAEIESMEVSKGNTSPGSWDVE